MPVNIDSYNWGMNFPFERSYEKVELGRNSSPQFSASQLKDNPMFCPWLLDELLPDDAASYLVSFNVRKIKDVRREALEIIQKCALDPTLDAPAEERALIVERAKEEIEKLTDPAKIAAAVRRTEATLEQLSKTAHLAKSLGNKTANLARLSYILKEERNVSVPAFLGLTHDEILNHIRTRTHFNQFDALWVEFQKQISAGETIASTAPLLNQIRAGIREAFNGRHPFLTEAALAPFKAGRMMVRSTGREDSLKVANPGGNTSVANVIPEQAAVEMAIGEVVVSYFSDKSLGQRRAVGDEIAEAPFMPVLLQTMAGEKPGAQSPVVSGVMYTTEGALQTQGVSQINATFGHAEAVVTGSRECDCFYVQGEDIHAILARKQSRLFPDPESGKLVSVENPKAIQTRPALSQSQVLRLNAIGRLLEASFGYPVDVEWTYDPTTDHFYIFQARPISHTMPKVHSYINPEKIKELEEVTAVNVIVPKGEVASLNDKNCIVAVSAPEALRLFLANPKGNFKAILIASPSAANSHEAGFFRERGIPLIYLPTALDFRQKLAAHTLLLDTQEGFIAILPKEKKAEEFVTIGLRYHLAPKMESFLRPELNTHTLRFLHELHSTAKPYGGPYEMGKNRLIILLNTFESAKDKESRADLLLKLLMTSKKLLHEIPEKERWLLWSKILQNAQEVWRVFNDPSSDEMSRKFAINWLRAVLVKSPTSNVVNGNSLYTELAGAKERRVLKLKPHDDPFLDTFLRSSKLIFSPKVREEWAQFVLHLKKEEIAILASFFVFMGPALMEVWLNKEFHLSNSKNSVFSDIDKIMKKKSNRENIQFVKRARAVAEQFQRMGEEFGDPEKFDIALEQLNQQFLPVAKECIEKMQKAKGRGVAATLLAQTYKDLVSTYDDCIKKFTSSHYENLKLKAKRFGNILEEYHQLTQLMLRKEMLNHDPQLEEQAEVLAPFLKERFYLLKSRADRNPNEMLLPSRDFSVNMSALGSGARRPERAPANTLEDFFTQLHQSLITATTSVEMVDGLKINELPQPLRDFCNHLCTLKLRGFSQNNPTIQSIEFHYPTIRVYFNAPLRNHSAQFVVEAQLDANGDVTKMEFVGRFSAPLGMGGRADRENEIALLALISMHPPYNMKPARMDKIKHEGFATFNWRVPLENKEAFDSFNQSSHEILQRMIDNLQVKEDPKLYTEELSDVEIVANPWLFKMKGIRQKLNPERVHDILKILIKEIVQEYSWEKANTILENLNALKIEDFDRNSLALLADTFFERKKGYFEDSDVRNNLFQLLKQCDELNLFPKETLKRLMNNEFQIPLDRSKIRDAIRTSFLEDLKKDPSAWNWRALWNLLKSKEKLDEIDRNSFALLADVFFEREYWDSLGPYTVLNFLMRCEELNLLPKVRYERSVQVLKKIIVESRHLDLPHDRSKLLADVANSFFEDFKKGYNWQEWEALWNLLQSVECVEDLDLNSLASLPAKILDDFEIPLEQRVDFLMFCQMLDVPNLEKIIPKKEKPYSRDEMEQLALDFSLEAFSKNPTVRRSVFIFHYIESFKEERFSAELLSILLNCLISPEMKYDSLDTPWLISYMQLYEKFNLPPISEEKLSKLVLLFDDKLCHEREDMFSNLPTIYHRIPSFRSKLIARVVNGLMKNLCKDPTKSNYASLDSALNLLSKVENLEDIDLKALNKLISAIQWNFFLRNGDFYKEFKKLKEKIERLQPPPPSLFSCLG